jgi:hypothetical protein
MVPEHVEGHRRAVTPGRLSHGYVIIEIHKRRGLDIQYTDWYNGFIPRVPSLG